MPLPSSIDRPQQSDDEIKQAVRETYARAVTNRGGGCCGASTGLEAAAKRTDLVELANYSAQELAGLPTDAVENAFGCGNPLSFAGVRPGDVVLDIGSGAGIDVLLAAKIVGPAGKVIGLDFTPEMIQRATENASRAGVGNVEFRLGDAEQMPLESASVDWVISNCVINLAPDKRTVFSEVFRVLKPGGRISIADIVTGELPAEIRNNLALWANCVAGAVAEAEYLSVMREAGLVDAHVLARQHYDEATVRSLVEANFPNQADRDQLAAFLGKNGGILNNMWSARIVARKPA